MEHLLDILRENKMICALLFLGILAFTFGGLYLTEVTAEESFQCPKIETINELAEEEENKMYVVDVKGAVMNPGVYRVPKKTIIQDVISLAGGLTKDASTENLNLGKAVTDEMVITVFTKDEVEEYTTEKEPITESSTATSSTKTTKVVNLNTATLEELETLPGIGEAKAKIIINYRETCGDFLNREELKNIKGIGEAIYAKLEKYITI